MGAERTAAREFIAESATRLVLLDTRVDATSAERLAEFAGFVGLPFEHVPIGLDFARLFLTRIVLEWRLENEKSTIGRSFDQYKSATGRSRDGL